MNKQADDIFYEAVALEIADHNITPALWARAFSKERGDPQRSLATYIDFRVAQLASDFFNAQKANKLSVASVPSPVRYKVENGIKVAVYLPCPHCAESAFIPLNQCVTPVTCSHCEMKYFIPNKLGK